MDITAQSNLKDTIDDMQIGDYIAAKYVTTDVKTLGTFSDIGNIDLGDPTNAQFDVATPTLDGYIYLTKIDTGVLITNHLLFSGVVYLNMNKQNLIAGVPTTIGSKQFLVRVPSIKELMKADSTLDGIVDIADAPANFGTTITNKEIVQENFNLSQGLFTWSNTASATTANAAAGTAAAYARLVLIYSESNKTTDVFH